MNKYIVFKIFGLVFLMSAIISCDLLRTPEQDVNPVVPPDESNPVVESLTQVTTGTVTEGDDVVFKLKINRPIERALTFTPVALESNTLEEHTDFDFAGPVIINPWETEGELVINTYADISPEETQTLSFTFTVNSIAEKYLLHPDNEFPTGNVDIENLTSQNLILEFHWDKDINLGGDLYSTAANTDFDVFMSPAEGFDINDPWASADYTYYAATGDHPEVIELVPGTLPDGEYVFWFDLWANGFAGYGVTTEIPVQTHAYQVGKDLNEWIDQDPSGVINADTPGADDEDGFASNAVLCKVTVSGNSFIVSNYEDVELGSTKSAVLRTPRPVNMIEKKSKKFILSN